MSKITQEQKEKFFELYKKGYRCRPLSRATNISLSFTQKIIRSFDAGDFSWLDSFPVHYKEFYSEDYGAKRMAKNLVSEGFCEQINHKKVERMQLLSVDEMKNPVDDYIYWYNNQRIQKN